MQLGTFAYVSPPGKFHPAVFQDNLRKFPARYPLVLYSDHKYDGMIPVGNPEQARRGGKKWAVNNLIFFTAMRIAKQQGYTHIIYIEQDSRVGCQDWDEMIFDEFFASGKAAVMGGSMVIYNPCNGNPVAAKRWEEVVRRNRRKNIPIPTYGWKGGADNSGSCIFSNGSLSVLDVQAISELFDLNKTIQTSALSGAWDMEIGLRLWREFEENSYFMVSHLDRMFSSYGNVLTTEEYRLNMLRNNEVVAIHQVKSDAQP